MFTIRARAADAQVGRHQVTTTEGGDLDANHANRWSSHDGKVGGIAVSGIRVGVGLEGHAVNDALLGQNFLSKFDVVLRENQMILQARK